MSWAPLSWVEKEENQLEAVNELVFSHHYGDMKKEEPEHTNAYKPPFLSIMIDWPKKKIKGSMWM